MVESKCVVLQMIPHTLFIEWDFGYYSRRCSLAVVKYCSHIQYCSCIRYCSHIRYYLYDQFFFFKCSFLDLFNLKFYA